MFLSQMTFNGMHSSFFPPSFMLGIDATNEAAATHHPPLVPSNPIQDFRGVGAMVGRRSVSFSGIEGGEDVGNGDDDLSDDCSLGGEKKRRLNVEQVKTLERNFEMGSKLEPERKMQLARALGLQPRQIAIWFQNRRARWKTKQLEKDYDALRRQFEALRSANEELQVQNKKLQAEQAQIMALKGIETPEAINLNKDTEGSCSNRSENTSELHLDISRTPTTDSLLDPSQGIPFYSSYKQPSSAPNVSHLLHTPTRPESPCIKTENGVQDESLSNMFCGLEDQSTAFWAWSEQHNFH